MSTPTGPECIANNGANGEPEVPFYDCPCAECTRMEWHVNIELNGRRETGTLKAFRHDGFPEYWDADGKPRCMVYDGDGLYCECPAGAPWCRYKEASRHDSRIVWDEIESAGRAALERLENR